MTTAVPAMVYTTALFSDAHVLRRSNRDDDDEDPDDDALMGIGPPDMMRQIYVDLMGRGVERRKQKGARCARIRDAVVMLQHQIDLQDFSPGLFSALANHDA